MVDLSETAAFAGQALPIEAGDCRLAACGWQAITAIAPWPGHHGAVDAALRGLGLGFPAAGEMIVAGKARAVWAGRETAFLMGEDAPRSLAEHAALTDQGDGWAGLHLSGAGAAATLARLVPLDLRLSAFPAGSVARSLLNHMPCLILRPAPEAFEVYTFRSMAGTAVHELAEAMHGVAARAALR